MKQLFHYANQYARESSWKDLGLIKVCLCAVGVMLGLSIQARQKKPAMAVAFSAFMATYVPLIYKFFSVVKRERGMLKEK